MALIRLNNQSLTNVTAAGLPTLAASNMPAGSVIQVLAASNTSSPVINSTSFTDIATSVSITPTSTSSKILVFASGSLQQDDFDGADAYARIARVDGGGTSGLFTAWVSSDRSGAVANAYSLQHLDSPATTSSITYKVQAHTSNATSDFRPIETRIAVMEIAG